MGTNRFKATLPKGSRGSFARTYGKGFTAPTGPPAWMNRVAAASLALLAVLTALPAPVAAQNVGETNVDLTLPNLGAPVRPGDPQNNSVTVRYSWSNGASQDNTTVRLEVVSEPPWLNSTFHPPAVEFDTAEQGPSGVQTRIINLTLDVARDAPAYTEGTATYRAVAEENGVLQRATVTTNFTVVAGFRGSIEASLLKGTNVTAWGGLVTEIPIRIQNQANGPLLVDVSVVRSPAEARIQAPPSARINATEGDRVATTNLEVLMPWTVSQSGTVVVELSPTHARRGTPLGDVELRFQLHGNSAVPIPSVPPPLAILAVVGLAVLLRRR